jgi:hypothetical protein
MDELLVPSARARLVLVHRLLPAIGDEPEAPVTSIPPPRIPITTATTTTPTGRRTQTSANIAAAAEPTAEPTADSLLVLVVVAVELVGQTLLLLRRG